MSATTRPPWCRLPKAAGSILLARRRAEPLRRRQRTASASGARSPSQPTRLSHTARNATRAGSGTRTLHTRRSTATHAAKSTPQPRSSPCAPHLLQEVPGCLEVRGQLENNGLVEFEWVRGRWHGKNRGPRTLGWGAAPRAPCDARKVRREPADVELGDRLEGHRWPPIGGPVDLGPRRPRSWPVPPMPPELAGRPLVRGPSKAPAPTQDQARRLGPRFGRVGRAWLPRSRSSRKTPDSLQTCGPLLLTSPRPAPNSVLSHRAGGTPSRRP